VKEADAVVDLVPGNCGVGCAGEPRDRLLPQLLEGRSAVGPDDVDVFRTDGLCVVVRKQRCVFVAPFQWSCARLALVSPP
jgi:hypothetical protein